MVFNHAQGRVGHIPLVLIKPDHWLQLNKRFTLQMLKDKLLLLEIGSSLEITDDKSSWTLTKWKRYVSTNVLKSCGVVLGSYAKRLLAIFLQLLLNDRWNLTINHCPLS